MAKAAARRPHGEPRRTPEHRRPGPRALPQITPEVCAALQQATDVIGYVPYVERARALLQAQAAADVDAIRYHASDNRVEIDRSRHALALAAQGHRVVVVSSGDPGVFAMASAVLEAVDHAAPAEAALWHTLDIQVLPGITAMLAAAHAPGPPWAMTFAASTCRTTSSPGR